MKKIRAEKVTLKRELHGFLKAQESILPTRLKNLLGGKKQLLASSHTELLADVVTILSQKIGEGTFGVVSIGHIKTLHSFCTVKEGKHFTHFNAIFEGRVLQILAGCKYFPYVFSIFDEKLVMELSTCEDNKVVTVSRMQKENKLASADWNVSFSLVSAVKYVHLKNLLQNDLKSNNVLLKLSNNVWIPKLTDMGKVTLKSNPETYKQVTRKGTVIIRTTRILSTN